MCIKKSFIVFLLFLFLSSPGFSLLSTEDQSDLNSLQILFLQQEKLIQDLELQLTMAQKQLLNLKNSTELTLQQKETESASRLLLLNQLEADLAAAREQSANLQNQIDKALKSSKKLKIGTLWNNLKWVAAGIAGKYIIDKIQ